MQGLVNETIKRYDYFIKYKAEAGKTAKERFSSHSGQTAGLFIAKQGRMEEL